MTHETPMTSTSSPEGQAPAEASSVSAPPASTQQVTAPPQGTLGPPPAVLQRWEIVTVFAVSLGASGVYALVQYIGSLTAHQALSKQAVIVHGTLAPGRPLLDLFLQLTSITLALSCAAS